MIYYIKGYDQLNNIRDISFLFMYFSLNTIIASFMYRILRAGVYLNETVSVINGILHNSNIIV